MVEVEQTGMKSRRSFAKEIALGLAVGSASIAGCSGGGDGGDGEDGGDGGTATATAEMEDMPTPAGAISPELIAAAQDDDTATIAGATGQSNAVDMTNGLGDTFSFASAEYVQLGDGEIASRLTSEAQSGNVTVDALFSSGRGAQATLVSETDTLRQNPDALIDVFDELGYPEQNYGDYYYPLNVFPIVTYYNTNKISESELPDTYMGMIEERFQGEIVTESPSVLGGMDAFFATLHEEWGEDQFEEWAQGLVDNDIQLTASGSTAYAELVNGNNTIGFGLIDDLVRARQDGEPNADFAWSMMNPHAVELQFPGALVNNAPNPDMGNLFAAYTASREGQEIIASWGAFPALPEVKQEAFPDLIPSDFSFETGVFNIDGYYNNAQEWKEYFDELGFGI